MNLSPLLGVGVVIAHGHDGTSDVPHCAVPIDFFDFILGKSKEAIDLFEGLEEHSARVGSAFFIAAREVTKPLGIVLAFFVTRLIGFIGNGVGEGGGFAIFISVDQLPNSMS